MICLQYGLMEVMEAFLYGFCFVLQQMPQYYFVVLDVSSSVFYLMIFKYNY